MTPLDWVVLVAVVGGLLLGGIWLFGGFDKGGGRYDG